MTYSNKNITLILTQRYKNFDAAVRRGLHPAIQQLINIRESVEDQQVLGGHCTRILKKWKISDPQLKSMINEKIRRRDIVRQWSGQIPHAPIHDAGGAAEAGDMALSTSYNTIPFGTLRKYLKRFDEALSNGVDASVKQLLAISDGVRAHLNLRQQTNYLGHCFDRISAVFGINSVGLAALIGLEQHSRLPEALHIPDITHVKLEDEIQVKREPESEGGEVAKREQLFPRNEDGDCIIYTPPPVIGGLPRAIDLTISPNSSRSSSPVPSWSSVDSENSSPRPQKRPRIDPDNERCFLEELLFTDSLPRPATPTSPASHLERVLSRAETGTMRS